MNESTPGSGQFASTLAEEARRSIALAGRWGSHLLNRVFDLSARGTKRRQLLAFLAALAFVVFALCIHMLIYVRYVRNGGFPLQLSGLMIPTILAALQSILILAIGGLLALHMAGSYLADIFEITDARIAWRFIDGLAFGFGLEVLHLSNGQIIEEDLDSPMVLIGGPGRVHVDFDTAALFEKPDGTPHVVGPAERQSQAGADFGSTTFVLEGFERLRQPIINLRDQYIGSLSGEPMTVIGRSRDGLPISVTDVRGLFSVLRSSDESPAELAHEATFPYSRRGIEDLVYKQVVPVLMQGEYPSGEPAEWTATMQELIRDSLAEFLSQNELSQYVAGVGDKELELGEYREDTILSKTMQFSKEMSEAVKPASLRQPQFRPRSELSSTFRQYSDDFAKSAREQGLQLHWIGVGTWKIPTESSSQAIKDKLEEAWRINHENAQLADPKSLEDVASNAALQETLRLIQETPLASHRRNQARYSAKEVLMESLLHDFWAQLGDALEIHYQTGGRSADLETVEAAVSRLEELLHIQQNGHVTVGATLSHIRARQAPTADSYGPPAPASRAEAEKYQALLGRLDGNFKVAEGIITHEAMRHPNLDRTALIARILKRFEQYGR